MLDNFFGYLLCGLFFLFVIGYIWSKIVFRKFSKKKISFIEPYPIFGNLLKSVLGIKHMSSIMKSIYDRFPDDRYRYVAIFEMLTPSIVLRSPELIKQVTVKDFEHFHDIAFQIDEEVDPVFGRALLMLKGHKWRQMRSTISPAFTSSKIRNMLQFMIECSSRYTKYFEDRLSSGNLKLDVKDINTRFTNDIVASTVFSFELDSLDDKENKFYSNAKLLNNINLLIVIKFIGFRTFPKLMKFFGIRLFPKNSIQYLVDLVDHNLTEREKSGLYRPDMIHLLNEAKKGVLKHDIIDDEQEEFSSVKETIIKEETSQVTKWSDDDLIAQAIIFIIAGFGTTSTLLNFFMYELALNPDIQKKLQNEIDSVLKNNNEKITYDSLKKLKYLDMVISETLRKWPPIPSINRLCVKEYNLGSNKEKSNFEHFVKKGEVIWIPVHSIHMDSQLWPNPDKFDPERFSDENKKHIKPYTYFPFGSGPRNCIGSRYALMSAKIMAFYFVSKFNFNVCAKTEIPINLNKSTLLLDSKEFWLELSKRNISMT